MLLNSLMRRMKLHLWRLPVYFTATDPNGSTFYGRWSHRVHLNWVKNGSTEPLTISELQRLILPGDNVVDVGVYIGVHTVAAAHAVGPTGYVTSVEPDAIAVKLLRKTLRANGLAERVRVVHAAAGASEGQAHLHRIYGDMSMNSTVGAGEGPRVHRVALDDIVVHADLIKIDVEGDELGVLQGAQRLVKTARVLIVECAPGLLRKAGNEPEDLVRRLREFGLEYIRVFDDRNETVHEWPASISEKSVNLICTRNPVSSWRNKHA